MNPARLLAVATLAGCVGSGGAGKPASPVAADPPGRATPGLLAGEAMAVSYSGFRAGQHPDRGSGAVNPSEPAILGERSYGSLADVPEPIDIVNVFRAPQALPGIAREAVAIGAKHLWCQFTVINEEGARIAEAGGLSVVMDRCIKVEHARYVGRMHWLGFNTQRITSVRGGLQ